MSHSPGLQQLNIWSVTSTLTKQPPICDLALHGARMCWPRRLGYISVFSHSKLTTGFHVAWLQITDRSGSFLQLHFLLSYFLRIWLLLQQVNKVNLWAHWDMGQAHNSLVNQSVPLLSHALLSKSWLSLAVTDPISTSSLWIHFYIHLFIKIF